MTDTLNTSPYHQYSVDEFRRTFSRLFANCESGDVEVLLRTFKTKGHLAAGNILIKQGKESDTLYLVCGGLLSVAIEGKDKVYNLGLISRGQWVGDVSMIEPGPASATVTVLEDTTLMYITKDEMDRLRLRHPRTASRLLNALSVELANRLRISSKMAMSIAEQSDIDVRNQDKDQPAKKWITNLGRWLSGVRNEDMVQFAREELKMQQMELAQKYKHLYKLEKENLLTNERERILAELHDGVGGQLVAMLSMLENRSVNAVELQDSVRAALDDLRLMIDSLDSVEGDLPVVLGMFRSRIEPRLMGQNIKFDWQVTDLPAVPDYGPHEVLQVLRILQEAVTNIIKHASANTISVITRYEENLDQAGTIKICVKDNGKGMDPTMKGAGHGRESMARRARDIGATLLVESDTSGTMVSLEIPVITVD